MRLCVDKRGLSGGRVHPVSPENTTMTDAEFDNYCNKQQQQAEADYQRYLQHRGFEQELGEWLDQQD